MPPAELDQVALRVLLVEDNADDALLVERTLRRNGFALEMHRAETAEEMLTLLLRVPDFELVLADYNLPRFSGPEALRLLKESGRDIPFIMLSGVISEATAVESMRAGAQDYVAKQNLARLVPAVERELKEAAARRKRIAAEAALRASRDQFDRLVRAMPVGLLICDASGQLIFANRAAERLLELAGAEDRTHRLEELCPAIESPRSILASGVVPRSFESSCRTVRTEQRVDVLLGMALLNPDTETDRRELAVFLTDLTLQKRSEEMLRRTEKLAVAGRLAASIAHEINNPLEAVTNLLYLLQHTDLSPEGRGYLKLAQSELNRVAQITVQTLRFHRRSTRPTATDLPELVHSVLALLDSRIRHTGVRVETRFRPTPKIVVHEGEIRQVIANLIGNAIDALAPGGDLLLRLAAQRHPVSGAEGIVITVGDGGVGMSPETLKRIFEPFFSTKGLTGTGLGLWISQDIIEKHRGSLRVVSRTAQENRRPGTVFRMFLPLEAAVRETAAV